MLATQQGSTAAIAIEDGAYRNCVETCSTNAVFRDACRRPGRAWGIREGGAAFDSGDMLDDPINAIARFMIEGHGWDAASIAETFAAEHIDAQEDEEAKLWADVAEQAKRLLARPRNGR
jgi:hypothetical protein